MRITVTLLCGLAALLSFTYLGFLTYLFLIGALPHKAALLGSYGVAVGMVGFIALPLSKSLLGLARSNTGVSFPFYLVAGCLLLMAGLFAIMQWLGQFDGAILGPYVRFLNYGAALGSAFGISMVAMLWFDEK